MTIVYTVRRQPLSLGEPLARGGEATVHIITHQPDFVAKIYKTLRDGYEHKLRWMTQNPPDEPNRSIAHPSIAWPHEVLYDERGLCVGYRMPRISDAVTLLEVFNPRLRAQVMKNCDWRFLHRAARNLASALQALHERDYVVGDLNGNNVLVKTTALVTLIDADSFQVRTDKRLFPCPVARWEYLPPELHGRELDETMRAPAHDAFGLAVLIYQLLMDGSHPFRGRWLDSGDPPELGERIRQGWFPYSRVARDRVAPLPNILPLTALAPELAKLFERCFIEGHGNPSARPAAAEWKAALANAEENLTLCARRHLYANHLKECAWCELQNTQLKAQAQSAGGAHNHAPPPPPVPPPRTRPIRARRRAPSPSSSFKPPQPVITIAPLPLSPAVSISRFIRSMRTAFRFTSALSRRLFYVVMGAWRFFNTPNARTLFSAARNVAGGAIAMTAIWAIIGAVMSAALGLLGESLAGSFAWNNALNRMTTIGVWLVSTFALSAAVFGALLTGVTRHRDAGGAWVGMMVAMLAAPFAAGSDGLLFGIGGAFVGALYGMVGVVLPHAPYTRGLRFAWGATRVLAKQLSRSAVWRLVGYGGSAGIAVSVVVWLLAVVNPWLAIVCAASGGFVGGVAVAMRRP